MKKIILISILALSVCISNAQEMSKKEKKAAQKAEQIEKTKALIKAASWQFDARQMIPTQGKSKSLTSPYHVILHDETVDSYLPYYGRAYRAEYGSTESPMTFKSDISEYTVENWKKGGWIIKFNAKNKTDNLDFIFTIAETGSATLSVTSTNRQSITYYGDIVEFKKKEKD